MKKEIRNLLILSTFLPINCFALCIGPCTPNYSAMPVQMTTLSNDDYINQLKPIHHPVQNKKLQNKPAVAIVKNNANENTVTKTAVPNNTTTTAQQSINITTPTTTPNDVTKENVEINESSFWTRYFNTDNNTTYDSSNHGSNPFNFSLYKPTYIIPIFHATEKPNSAVAVESGQPTNDFPISPSEFDFQLSFKVPVWENIFVWPDTLYMAYTQDSYWQLYTDDPYFRETDYEPEVFLDNEINKSLGYGWNFSDLDLGAMHQSNGRGGITERSWNRAYFTTDFTNGNWLISIQPWTPIFADESSNLHNPNITHFLGYGQETVAYNYDNNTFSLSTRNVVESNFSRGAEWLTWSFPLFHRNIKGYVYLFSGFGYDLIDYNHYLNGAGLGITLNDWM